MKKSRVVVFGSFAVDLLAIAPHLPKPAETVKGSLFQKGPGGKGFNQAVAAHKVGADVAFVTKLGKDAFADVALTIMDDLGMSRENLLFSDTAHTGTALIMVDENSAQNQIVVVPGSCATISDEEVRALECLLADADFLLLQLETNLSAVEQVIDVAHRNGCRVILNPAPVQKISAELFKKIDMVTPNEVEAEGLSGVPVHDEAGALAAAQWFQQQGVKDVIITMGEKGVFVLTEDNSSHFVSAHTVHAVDTTGAGDAFNGGFLAALAEDKTILDAVAFGNAVAALSVQKMGSALSMPTRSEVDDFIAQQK